ncbi:MAG: hydrogenase maturation nickel metallochaperone HypA, partial [Nitrososphaerota archaeon]
MHEFTVAMGIVDSLKELYLNKGFKINSFKIVIGELSMFNPSIINDLVRELIKETELENTKFKVIIEEAKIKCESCNQTHSFN